MNNANTNIIIAANPSSPHSRSSVEVDYDYVNDSLSLWRTQTLPSPSVAFFPSPSPSPKRRAIGLKTLVDHCTGNRKRSRRVSISEVLRGEHISPTRYGSISGLKRRAKLLGIMNPRTFLPFGVNAMKNADNGAGKGYQHWEDVELKE
jgi:hypothetical protein